MSKDLLRFRMTDQDGTHLGFATIEGIYHLTPWEKLHEGMKRFVACLWLDYRIKGGL